MTLFPTNIQIETHRGCPAGCEFCGHSLANFNGKFRRMPDELIEKIISEVASWDPPYTGTICPFLTNEPMVDLRIGYWCREINRRIPNSKLVLFTIGAWFTPVVMDGLFGIHFDRVHLSLHSLDPEEYRRRVKLPLAKTLASIDRFLEKANAFFMVDTLAIHRVPDGDKDADVRFLEACASRFPGIPAGIAHRYNWKGDVSSHETSDASGIPCSRWDHICIMADGKVALCCMDQNGDFSVGDVTKQTILEVFNGPAYLKYREQTTRVLNPCSKCNMQ